MAQAEPPTTEQAGAVDNVRKLLHRARRGAGRSRTARQRHMAEAGSTALHVTRQGTLVAASSSLRVRIVAAGGATLHEGLLPGTAEACAIQLNDTGTRQGPRRAPSPAPDRSARRVHR